MLVQPISKNNQILRVLLASLFSVSIASAQQSNCSLRLDRLPGAPELRGFHLGMTYEQVKARVPQIRFGRADEFGVSKTRFVARAPSPVRKSFPDESRATQIGRAHV